MTTTGRLGEPVGQTARQILFERHLVPAPDPLVAELDLISEVDRAHVVMLAEQGVVAPAIASRLLSGIEAVRADRFAALRERPAPRGRYLSYESYLVERFGVEVGGALHSGRSRNDLQATVTRLRLRAPHDQLLVACDGLGRALLAQARRGAGLTMPAYTHHQPAVPITYGHYLAGVAAALVRDVEQVWQAGEEIDHNPLGAGAVGGTSLPIDQRRTTALLGFAAAIPNSVDAVASRDFVLRLLGAGAVLGVLLCRVAHDLQAWTSAEAGLLHLPDDLVGSSSMMPQKRNPFLLEHVQGRATAALGAFTAACAAMGTARFTNAIAVGTEAVSHLWPALEATTEATTLLRLVIEGAEPVADRMRQRAVDGQTVATHLAERLVGAGVPFRSAHHTVGTIAAEALELSRPFEDVARARLSDHGPAVWDGLDPDAVAASADFGGGPGAGSVRGALDGVERRLASLHRLTDARRRRWAAAAADLEREVRSLIDGRPGGWR